MYSYVPSCLNKKLASTELFTHPLLIDSTNREELGSGIYIYYRSDLVVNR